jgi:hypothetical protein
MMMAYVPNVDPTNRTLDPRKILPSFHRPDLINYHRANSTAWGTSSDLKRRAILRPGTFDHPGFTGSNPTFDPVNGPWDVDNDGDGVAESVWVDIGLPVQAGPDGRRYKPLVAYYCTDLDGRLNVNAHGTWAHSLLHYDTSPDPTNQKPLPQAAGNINHYLFNPSGSALQYVSLPRGMGVGPAEIDLSWLWGYEDTLPRLQSYQRFLEGAVGPDQMVHEGRYGEWVGTGSGQRFAGRADKITVTPYAINGSDDLLALIRRYDMPLVGTGFKQYNWYAYPNASNYGSPCDLQGRSMVGVDYAGQPIWSFHRDSATNDVLGYADWDAPSDPYTLNLSRKRIRGATDTVPTIDDNVFTPAELERVLRRSDIDASILPDRLRYLLDETGNSGMDYAHLVTTDSFDLPTPAVAATRDMVSLDIHGNLRLTAPSQLTIVDLLKQAFVKNGAADTDVTQDIIADLLPPEVIAGQKFDLNRPFGNGRDDNGNGVVDEPGEVEADFWNNSNLAAVSGGFTTTVPDYSNGTDVNNNSSYGEATDSQMSRQLYARYLYVLMYLLTDMEYSGYGEPGLTPQQVFELNARRIAQWAINVVDYRDADSIMTPFEYDLYPFDVGGWQVDGVLGASSTDDNAIHRRLVWGCESPSLLLTETLALHDRRVQDTNSDPSGKRTTDMMSPDEDVDQIRIPEGSLFLEMFCPENGNNSVSRRPHSQDLYAYDGTSNTWKLNLGQLAPSGGGFTYPVWRVAILESALGTGATRNSIPARVANKPDTLNFDPVPPIGGFGGLPGTLQGFSHGSVFDSASPGGAVTPERLVWFTTVVPTIAPSDLAISFYNANLAYEPTAAPSLLAPGQYAVVGPRPVTHVGLNAATPTVPSTQAFQFTLTGAGSFSYVAANGSSPPGLIPPQQPVTNLPVLPIVCSFHDKPGTRQIGLNVTEPLFQSGNPASYYPVATDPGPTGPNEKYLPQPLDNPADGTSATAPAYVAPLKTDNIFSSQTRQNYKTALLQRLANPLAAHDPTSNPYITVDWQPIDLTVFNGEAKQTGMEKDPEDPVFATPPATFVAGGRERGVLNPANPSAIWSNLTQTPTNVASALGPNDVFDYNIHQTFGYLNRSMGATAWGSGAPTMTPVNYGYQNAPTPSATSKPFSWLTWNNRPFTNPMELLLVPHESPERLLRDFTTGVGTPPSPYTGVSSTSYWAFKHLGRTLQSGDGASITQAPYLYRILDYVGVPSPFVGTDTVFSPDKFGSGAFPKQEIISTYIGANWDQALASYLHPPFSRVSNYRDPGRVNINTIAAVDDPDNSMTWQAIINGSTTSPAWQALIASRRDDTGLGNDVTTPDSSKPSVFWNPFRTAGGAAYRLPRLPLNPPDPEINVTMLRPHPADANRPLFSPLPDPTRPYVDPNQHAYFRYQDLMRLSNSLTTRSNVYAVWITVGYFEVAPAPSGPSGVNYNIYPDGWQLGAELGSDTGDIQRHRAFYIFDRSIPVGYEPGKDHNLDDATLVKRYIE